MIFLVLSNFEFQLMLPEDALQEICLNYTKIMNRIDIRNNRFLFVYKNVLLNQDKYMHLPTWMNDYYRVLCVFLVAEYVGMRQKEHRCWNNTHVEWSSLYHIFNLDFKSLYSVSTCHLCFGDNNTNIVKIGGKFRPIFENMDTHAVSTQHFSVFVCLFPLSMAEKFTCSSVSWF